MEEVTYIAGEDEEKCDRLSRRWEKPRRFISDDAAELGMPGVRVEEMNQDVMIMGINKLCDPRIEVDSKQQIIHFWTSATLPIGTFLAVHGPA
jgi:hypothetical protein